RRIVSVFMRVYCFRLVCKRGLMRESWATGGTWEAMCASTAHDTRSRFAQPSWSGMFVAVKCKVKAEGKKPKQQEERGRHQKSVTWRHWDSQQVANRKIRNKWN